MIAVAGHGTSFRPSGLCAPERDVGQSRSLPEPGALHVVVPVLFKRIDGRVAEVRDHLLDAGLDVGVVAHGPQHGLVLLLFPGIAQHEGCEREDVAGEFGTEVAGLGAHHGGEPVADALLAEDAQWLGPGTVAVEDLRFVDPARLLVELFEVEVVDAAGAVYVVLHPVADAGVDPQRQTAPPRLARDEVGGLHVHVQAPVGLGWTARLDPDDEEAVVEVDEVAGPGGEGGELGARPRRVEGRGVLLHRVGPFLGRVDEVDAVAEAVVLGAEVAGIPRAAGRGELLLLEIGDDAGDHFGQAVEDLLRLPVRGLEGARGAADVEVVGALVLELHSLEREFGVGAKRRASRRRRRPSRVRGTARAPRPLPFGEPADVPLVRLGEPGDRQHELLPVAHLDLALFALHRQQAGLDDTPVHAGELPKRSLSPREREQDGTE